MGHPAPDKEGARGPHRGRQHRRLGLARVSFVGGKKATLDRLFREKAISLTAEANARIDALPEPFVDFIAAPERFAVQWAEAA